MKRQKGCEIVNITVDIGNGEKDNISVHEFDDPATLSHEFSTKHNLPQKLETALTRNINDLIKEFNRDQSMISSFLSSKPEFSSNSCKNIGEKMYLKGIRHKEQIEANKQLMKMKLEKEISQTTSFKPVINKNSKKLAKNNQSRSNAEIRQTPKIEDQECTFSPQINERSLKIAGNSTNRIQELYEEAKLKKNRIESMNLQARKNEFPFKPNIKHKGEYSDPSQLIERLSTSKDHYYENLKELQKKYEIKRDPVTGQDFFKPNISKTAKNSREVNNV